MKRFILFFVVFISGAVVMAFEVVGSRVLAPVFGSSVIVWTALIGVILGALSVGYWLGGNLADKRPSRKYLVAVLLFAGLMIAGMALAKTDVLLVVAEFPGLRIGVTISALILFAPASVFLGMVSPFAARLALEDVEHSGSIVGNLYALSTLGSILGTFLAGFWLLPAMGNTSLLFWLAAIEVGTALFLMTSKKQMAAVVLLASLFVMLASVTSADISLTDGDGVDIDTQYSRIRIYDDTDSATSRPVRRLSINNSYSSAMFLDGDGEKENLVYRYTRFYRLGEYFVPNIRRALMIGGGAYSYPKDFLTRYPEAKLDVIEIDPDVTRVAREYFDLKDNANLRIFDEDARTFINRETQQYDVIYIDAFRSNTIPFQLASKEAFEAFRGLLSKDGVIMMNVISPIDGERGVFFRALYWTLRDVFPQVEIFHVREQYDPKLVGNLMIVAFVDDVALNLKSLDPEITDYLDNIWRKDIAYDMPIITDDFNPADFYSSAYLERVKR